ncbi:MAG: trypsin-like peptidase domain-containing protein [Candidatus Bathyarchaeota archaeon]|uniref:trypsin-like peptidase domain-containing protein n=1 Tax=Candidatus Bathycorpusculum sp. TaxID=2994959 RepID=UPI0028350D65|nr:trypsin-like peptidase domain-containing protein [Candidatus Termiticorpusculum sp.]MCL2257758.1 trypsin-like peptidase domain-containing protein [Candidatus Termiticorpusculum sp.]MCL2292109.1 trypsin-like peptidase domain-containing protein [Candidatus Termiticorpusculum sp.]
MKTPEQLLNKNNVVSIHVMGKKIGTGCIISNDGIIITAAHILDEGVTEYSVKIKDTFYTAELASSGKSQKIDFATLKLVDKINLDLPLLQVNLSIKENSYALTLGFPIEDTKEYYPEGQAIGGKVGAVNQFSDHGYEGKCASFTTDEQTTKGFSGAPVFINNFLIGSIISEIPLQDNKGYHIMVLLLEELFRLQPELKKYFLNIQKSFEDSEAHYQRLRKGQFAYIEFDENLFAGTQPLDILLKDPDEKTETLLDTIKSHDGHFIFIGEGGTGKTTSLLQIWEEWLKEKKELPLYVPLNEYNINKQENFIETYIKRWHQTVDLSSPAEEPVILLLDGFNEISGNPDKIIQEIKALSESQPKMRIVLTSRHSLITRYGLDGFRPYDIQPLSAKRIEKFWENTKRANAHLLGISLPDNWQTLLSTPMMLTLFTNTCAVQKSMEKSDLFPFKPTNTKGGPQTKGELIYNYLLCQLAKLVHQPV